MPIYEYFCYKCNYKIEKFQKINEKFMLKCPTCDILLKKIMSLSTFQLKGKGWYKTELKK